MKRTALKTIVFVATNAMVTWPRAVFAHDGHGLSGSHWHASDTWGLVVLAVGLALVVGLSGRDK
ncbi:MAG: hypothetical protein EB064_10770 [Betaproteobacteria bacterium]|nr:hypothetical protein [Betaproteobacteria bacterium]